MLVGVITDCDSDLNYHCYDKKDRYWNDLAVNNITGLQFISTYLTIKRDFHSEWYMHSNVKLVLSTKTIHNNILLIKLLDWTIFNIVYLFFISQLKAQLNVQANSNGFL